MGHWQAGGTDGPLQQPFKNDPAKQMRFEQFMKDKSVGGLRKPTSGGSGLSEVQRSQEIFEFEAVARLQQEGLSLEKLSTPIVSNNLVPDLVAMMGSRFTTAGAQSKSLVVRNWIADFMNWIITQCTHYPAPPSMCTLVEIAKSTEICGKVRSIHV